MLTFINSYPNLRFPQAGGKQTAVKGSAPNPFPLMETGGAGHGGGSQGWEGTGGCGWEEKGA